jgi:hypothetical protein
VDSSQGHDYARAQFHAIFTHRCEHLAGESSKAMLGGMTMSNQDLIVKEMTQIPAEIEELWGEPPVLPTEDLKAYEKLCLEVAKNVGPTDIIEWLWIKDICDLSWEIRRLRGLKVRLVKGDGYFNTMARNYGRLDAVAAAVESRRNAVLREIERRRESVASRLRKASDDIIDGEFTEHRAPTETIDETEGDRPALAEANHHPTRDAA